MTDYFRGTLGRPGGHGEGQSTRSHPELGRETPQRRWYCVLRRGRVGRRQVFRTCPHIACPTAAGWSSPVARQAHNLKVVGSNPTPATTHNVPPSPEEAAAVFCCAQATI